MAFSAAAATGPQHAARHRAKAYEDGRTRGLHCLQAAAVRRWLRALRATVTNALHNKTPCSNSLQGAVKILDHTGFSEKIAWLTGHSAGWQKRLQALQA
jgi:hypothetical protein